MRVMELAVFSRSFLELYSMFASVWLYMSSSMKLIVDCILELRFCTYKTMFNTATRNILECKRELLWRKKQQPFMFSWKRLLLIRDLMNMLYYKFFEWQAANGQPVCQSRPNYNSVSLLVIVDAISDSGCLCNITINVESRNSCKHFISAV